MFKLNFDKIGERFFEHMVSSSLKITQFFEKNKQKIL